MKRGSPSDRGAVQPRGTEAERVLRPGRHLIQQVAALVPVADCTPVLSRLKEVH